ncbi:hypothetical protein [Peribacillus frigoritolerans]|uniref:hypothetical protein n=1 Tax=Peribacillus frigoritolerans TaxID=450367 RepID=UPI002E1A8BFC|nr:hypothetical protein [Peribacillus frigoritolerans]
MVKVPGGEIELRDDRIKTNGKLKSDRFFLLKKGNHEILSFKRIIKMQPEWLNSFRQNGFSEVNILRSSTALEQLMNSSVSNSPLQPLNESLKRVMDEHYRLIFPYGNSHGYRVSEQAKSNLQLQEVTQVLQFVYTDY